MPRIVVDDRGAVAQSEFIPTCVPRESIVVAGLTKVAVEFLLLPVTLKVSLWLKGIENVDYFDKTTSLNPLRF